MTDNNRLQEIAERIKELREIFAYSQEEMAEKTEVTIAEYAMYEGAELDFPFTFLHKCALAFGISITFSISVSFQACRATSRSTLYFRC